MVSDVCKREVALVQLAQLLEQGVILRSILDHQIQSQLARRSLEAAQVFDIITGIRTRFAYK